MFFYVIYISNLNVRRPFCRLQVHKFHRRNIYIVPLVFIDRLMFHVGIDGTFNTHVIGYTLKRQSTIQDTISFVCEKKNLHCWRFNTVCQNGSHSDWVCADITIEKFRTRLQYNNKLTKIFVKFTWVTKIFLVNLLCAYPVEIAFAPSGTVSVGDIIIASIFGILQTGTHTSTHPHTYIHIMLCTLNIV